MDEAAIRWFIAARYPGVDVQVAAKEDGSLATEFGLDQRHVMSVMNYLNFLRSQNRVGAHEI